jgi:hypothetical protein
LDQLASRQATLSNVDIAATTAATSNLVVLFLDAADIDTLDLFARATKGVTGSGAGVCVVVMPAAAVSPQQVSSDLVLCGLQDVVLAEVGGFVTVTATKPTWEVGASAKVKISFSKPAPGAGWGGGADDDVIDEDELLDDADFSAEAKAKARGAGEACAPRRAACKNCSCGRAEGVIPEPVAAAATPAAAAAPAAAPKSSCGSCYLGDAFRCSTCPYLGQPSFEPGDKLKLKTSDDVTAAAAAAPVVAAAPAAAGKVTLTLDDDDF